jgi:hypothetical protein
MQFEAVKVFTRTKKRDRERLSDEITTWLREKRPQIIDKCVRLSSDREFHCLSIIFFYNHS